MKMSSHNLALPPLAGPKRPRRKGHLGHHLFLVAYYMAQFTVGLELERILIGHWWTPSSVGAALAQTIAMSCVYFTVVVLTKWLILDKWLAERRQEFMEAGAAALDQAELREYAIKRIADVRSRAQAQLDKGYGEYVAGMKKIIAEADEAIRSIEAGAPVMKVLGALAGRLGDE